MTNSPFLMAYAAVNAVLVGTPAQSHISACLGRYIATNNLGDSIPYGHLWDHSHLIDPNHVLRAFLLKAVDLGDTQNGLFREGDAAFIESSVKSYLKQLQDQSTDCGQSMKAITYEDNPASDIRGWLGLSASLGILDEVRFAEGVRCSPGFVQAVRPAQQATARASAGRPFHRASASLRWHCDR